MTSRLPRGPFHSSLAVASALHRRVDVRTSPQRLSLSAHSFQPLPLGPRDRGGTGLVGGTVSESPSSSRGLGFSWVARRDGARKTGHQVLETSTRPSAPLNYSSTLVAHSTEPLFRLGISLFQEHFFLSDEPLTQQLRNRRNKPGILHTLYFHRHLSLNKKLHQNRLVVFHEEGAGPSGGTGVYVWGREGPSEWTGRVVLI